MNIFRIARLKEKKHRKESGLFMVEGDKGVLETIAAHGDGMWHIEHIYGTAEFLGTHGEKLKAKRITSSQVDRGELAKAGSMEVQDGAIAVVRMPAGQTAPDSEDEGIMLAVDGIKDPGNLGTIIRTADWFGVSTVICSTDTVDMFNPKCISATMGSFLRVQTVQLELADVLQSAKGNGVSVYATAMKGTPLTEFTNGTKQFKKPCIVVIGSESHGVKPKLISLATETITIPRVGKAESLNVGIATGIILSAVCR